jgi:hypothetical protein
VKEKGLTSILACFTHFDANLRDFGDFLLGLILMLFFKSFFVRFHRNKYLFFQSIPVRILLIFTAFP